VKDFASKFAASGVEAAARDVTTVRRDDLAASLAAGRAALRMQANNRRGLQAVAAALAAEALAVLAWYLCDAAGLPAWVSLGTALTITTAFSVGLVRMLVRSTRRILSQYQLVCPSCGHEMLALADLSGQPSVADLTVETGRCAHCGEVSFAA
jgi:peptidoglycan/LPS O-acetylase OafA/YrhL